MATLSHSSTASQAAEALLNRARRLSSNAYERSCSPTAFAEGEDNQPSHYDSLLRPRSSNMLILHRSSSRPSSLTNPLSTTTSSSTTSTTTTPAIIASTPIIVSDAEGISLSATDQTSSQALSSPSSSTTNNNNDNTFLDPNRAHTLPCTISTSALSSPQSRLTSLSARPRALTLEAIREVRVGPESEDGESNNKSPKDHHRKHRSENGGSLVRDILVALRQSTELESPTFSRYADLTTRPSILMSPGQKAQQEHSRRTHDGVVVVGGGGGGLDSSPAAKRALSPKQNSQEGEMAESNSEADTEESRAVRETTAGAPLPPGVVRDGGGDAVTADETREIETPDQTFSSDDDSSDVSQEGAIAPAQGDNDDGNEKEEGIDSPAVSESSTALAAESPEFTTITRANSLPPSQSTSAMHQMLEREFSRKEGGKEGGKGAFLLHRIGVRKNSFTESAPPSSVAALSSPMLDGGSGSSDTSIVRSQSTQRSTGSGGPHHKLSKRSTKLLGKFVPKFLQTSFSPSLSTPGGGVGGGNTSPHLQTAGVSPLSSRSSRSGSISGQSGQSDTAGSSIGAGGSSAPSSNKSSRESLTLDVIHDTESLSPGYTRMDATSPQYLELLRSDTHINPSLMARRSSCSSATSKMSGNSLGSKPSASSMSSFDPSESNEYRRNSGSGSTKGGDGMCAFEVEYDDEDSEEDHGDEETSMTVDGDHEAATNTAETDDPPISPYIIDDDCDDDFFLNSVLRKKPSVPSFSPTMAMMASSYPSSTTISSIHSSATTPSLSGWSSSSSQTSTPSPTSPLLLNGQVYSFPVTHSSSNNGYRSNNPLPPAINFGQDEKRSRLRDAVGEWRRSAIASNQL